MIEGILSVLITMFAIYYCITTMLCAYALWDNSYRVNMFMKEWAREQSDNELINKVKAKYRSSNRFKVVVLLLLVLAMPFVVFSKTS